MLQPGSMAAGEWSHGGGVDQVVMGPSDRELNCTRLLEVGRDT